MSAPLKDLCFKLVASTKHFNEWKVIHIWTENLLLIACSVSAVENGYARKYIIAPFFRQVELTRIIWLYSK